MLVGIVWGIRLVRPKGDDSLAASPRSRGPLNAPVQVIEYSDFQCPACRVAQTQVEQILKEYGDRVRVVYQHFPLEGHRWAPLAHRAAECAARENRFWSYHDLLYQRQPAWSTRNEPPVEILLRLGVEDGMDLERFGRCLADPDVDQVIRENKLTGSSLGVRQTPSFFVNGKLVVGTGSLRQEVERILSE